MSNSQLALPGRPAESSRLIGIEVIRFIAAISVLVWHYQHFAYIGASKINFNNQLQPFYDVLSPLYNSGFLGVQVFWCISGFIFFWKYSVPLASGMVDAKSFAIARFARLYPLHLATLLLVAILQFAYFSDTGKYFVYQANDLKDFGLQLAFASNWGLQLADSFNGPIWSVSVEILVYVFFFMAIRLLGVTTAPKILLVAVAAMLASHMRTGFTNQTNILDCISCFYFGGLTAVTYLWVERMKSGPQKTIDILVLVIGSAATVCHANSWGFRELLYIATICWIYLCCRYVRPKAPFQITTLEYFGNLTYSSYLLHFPIQLSIVLIYARLGITVSYQSKWLFIGFMAATLLAAGVCFSRFERPVQSFLRRKLINRRANLSDAVEVSVP